MLCHELREMFFSFILYILLFLANHFFFFAFFDIRIKCYHQINLFYIQNMIWEIWLIPYPTDFFFIRFSTIIHLFFLSFFLFLYLCECYCLERIGFLLKKIYYVLSQLPFCWTDSIFHYFRSFCCCFFGFEKVEIKAIWSPQWIRFKYNEINVYL